VKRFSAGVLLASAVLLTGCVVKDVKPLAKINPVQAAQQIAPDELLDVAVREFDAGLPQDISDVEGLAKKRVYPDVRKAESRMLAANLRSTLEGTGQWGAVRVVPESVQFVDVVVTGRILDSTGRGLGLEISARDSQNRVWINKKVFRGDADIGSYKTEAALKARDPFQNVYSLIANELLAARERLSAAERREIRKVTDLRFAQDLAPDAFSGYLATDSAGVTRIARLPAAEDPQWSRVRKIRERDVGVVDTVDGYYTNFNERISESYGGWRRTSYDAIEKEERTRNQARARTALGAAAVLASIFVSGSCAAGDYDCQRMENAARGAGATGGIAAVLSGVKKYSDAKVAAQDVRELADSFQNEVSPQVVELEGRTLKLQGTAEEQYREWRKLLSQIYREETGGVAAPVAAPAPASAPAAPGSSNAPPPPPPAASGGAPTA
jgi:hypothetical protein